MSRTDISCIKRVPRNPRAIWPMRVPWGGARPSAIGTKPLFGLLYKHRMMDAAADDDDECEQ
jgi:hypothetical protein